MRWKVSLSAVAALFTLGALAAPAVATDNSIDNSTDNSIGNYQPRPVVERKHQAVQEARAQQTLTAIGPYQPWRWQNLSTPPTVCVDNRSSRPFQNAVAQWQTNPDFNVLYENGGFGPNCAGFGNDYRIDVENGYADNGACTYMFYVVGEDLIMDRMIVYANTTTPNCWDSQIRTNHFTSVGIGTGLGMRIIITGSGSDPGYVSVMRDISYDTVSWPQAGDHNTLAYYNGASHWLVALVLCAVAWLAGRRARRIRG